MSTTSSSLQDLVDELVAAATNYGKCIEAGNSRMSDKYLSRGEKTLKKIKSFGDSGVRTVALLLAHREEGVRLLAATDLLDRPEFKSHLILEAMVKSKSILGLSAELILGAWRRGEPKH